MAGRGAGRQSIKPQFARQFQGPVSSMQPIGVDAHPMSDPRVREVRAQQDERNIQFLALSSATHRTTAAVNGDRHRIRHLQQDGASRNTNNEADSMRASSSATTFGQAQAPIPVRLETWTLTFPALGARQALWQPWALQRHRRLPRRPPAHLSILQPHAARPIPPVSQYTVPPAVAHHRLPPLSQFPALPLTLHSTSLGRGRLRPLLPLRPLSTQSRTSRASAATRPTYNTNFTTTVPAATGATTTSARAATASARDASIGLGLDGQPGRVMNEKRLKEAIRPTMSIPIFLSAIDIAGP